MDAKYALGVILAGSNLGLHRHSWKRTLEATCSRGSEMYIYLAFPKVGVRSLAPETFRVAGASLAGCLRDHHLTI